MFSWKAVPWVNMMDYMWALMVHCLDQDYLNHCPGSAWQCFWVFELCGLRLQRQGCGSTMIQHPRGWKHLSDSQSNFFQTKLLVISNASHLVISILVGDTLLSQLLKTWSNVSVHLFSYSTVNNLTKTDISPWTTFLTPTVTILVHIFNIPFLNYLNNFPGLVQLSCLILRKWKNPIKRSRKIWQI